MRIGFVTIANPVDQSAWSGIPANMYSALQRSAAEIVPLGPLRRPGRNAVRIVGGMRNRFMADEYKVDRERWLCESYARQIRRMMATENPIDLLVTPGSIPVSLADVGVPIAIWADATVNLMLDYYPQFSDWSPRTRRVAEAMEQEALRRAALFVGPSAWATEDARDHYGVRETAIIPFGANIDLEDTANRRDPSSKYDGRPARALLVGVDWLRKGVPLAIDAVRLARNQGLDVEIDIVGCSPPSAISLPPWVKCHGLLDKTKSRDAGLLRKLFEDSHLFILPSTAECFGVAVCEAYAFGIPAIVRNTGGLGSIVKDGVTGRKIDELAGPWAYCEAISDLMSSSDRYTKASYAARVEYERVFNWDSAVHKLLSAVAHIAK